MTSVGLLGAPREPSEHYVVEVAKRAVFRPKSQSRNSLWRPFSFGGQLVAPSGPLFEVLFVTLGRYWGPAGPELHKDVKIDEKWGPEGKPF